MNEPEPSITRQDLAHRAQDIVRLLADLRPQMGLEAAIDAANERFVDHEVHPQLRRLGEVMMFARRQALIQNHLDDDREALHHGDLDHEQRISTGHHYEMLRHQACTYNHLLRGFIESCAQYFSRDELLGWLTSASAGRDQWARAEVTGAVSEIALHAALQGMTEIKDLRYASVEEDLVGYDFVAEWQGRLLTIDAKTGFYRPLAERKHGHAHLEISVPHEAIKGLQVNHRGLRVLRGEIRQVLGEGTETELMASPRAFQAAIA